MRTYAQVHIDAAPGTAWTIMTDVPRWPEWNSSVRNATARQHGPLSVGSRFRIRQPWLPRATWTVTAIEPGRSFTWANSSIGLSSTATHRVDSTERGGALVTLELLQTGPLAFLLKPYARLTRGYVQREASGLKYRSESERSLAGGPGDHTH